MGFFDRLKQKKEIERLETAVRGAPSPALYVELADRHIASGDVERAYQVIDAGHRAFPASEAIFKTYVALKKRRVQDSIRDLHAQIESAPSASAYARLASLYREIHEEERCVDICREAMEKFPADDSPHQILGEIRLDRFRADYYHKDGRIAIEHLERAVERNETNYKALVALAKFYLEIGAVGHALKCMRSIQAFAPSDPAVEDLLAAAANCPPAPDEDVDELLRQVEAKGRMNFPLAPGRRTKLRTRSTSVEVETTKITRGIDRLRSIPGFVAAGVAHEERGVLAQANGAGDGDEFGTAMAEYCASITAHCRRMDIGNLTRAQIDGSFGQVFVARLERIVLAVLVGSSQDGERVWSEMQAYLDECCRAAGGDET